MSEILFLSTYYPSYIKPLKKWASILQDGGFRVMERYPDTSYKNDVLHELERGWDYVVYFGHGIPGAWCGYGKIDSIDFSRVQASKNITTVLSFSCYGLSRQCGPSLGEVFIQHLEVKEFAGFKGRVLYRNNLQCFEAMMLHLLQGNRLDSTHKLPAPLQWVRAKDYQARKENLSY